MVVNGTSTADSGFGVGRFQVRDEMKIAFENSKRALDRRQIGIVSLVKGRRNRLSATSSKVDDSLSS